MNILGINAYHGNASAAVVCDGKLIAAVEEERFNRIKYAAGFPAQAIRYCVKEAGLKLGEKDYVGGPPKPYGRVGEKTFLTPPIPVVAGGTGQRVSGVIRLSGGFGGGFDNGPKNA